MDHRCPYCKRPIVSDEQGTQIYRSVYHPECAEQIREHFDQRL